jgi:hypothetical protein
VSPDSDGSPVRPPEYSETLPTTRPSAYRFAIPCGALLLFIVLGSLWVFGFQPVYFAALRRLGVEPYGWPFLDTHAILAAAECYRQGIDVYLMNPCDVMQRTHSYSPLWLIITPDSWGIGVTPWLGVILDLLFILALPLALRPRSAGETIILAFAAFSPMTILALERGNNDIVIFLLILAGVVLYRMPRPYRLGSYALFLIAGFLKYYPLVLLAFIARERWRGVFLPAAMVMAALLLFGASYYGELGHILATIPAAPYFTNAFSAKNLPYGFAGLMPDYPFLPRAFMAIALLGILLAVAAARILRNLRFIATTTRIDWNEPEALLLAIGSLLLTACFFAGSNMDYRGIFFLLALPGLVHLRQSAPSATIKRWLSSLIAATLFVMWKEFFRHNLYELLDSTAHIELGEHIKFLFWLARELVWWWLVTGFATIAILHLWQMPLTKDSVAGLRRLAGLSPNPL